MQRLMHNIAVNPERKFAEFKVPRDVIFSLLGKRLFLLNMRYYFKVPYSPSGSLKILNSMFEDITSYKRNKISWNFNSNYITTITNSQVYYFTTPST
jgi:hypothetical protein